MVVEILEMGYGDTRNVIDLFDEIISHEEIFKLNHPNLIQITNSFLQYYTDNKLHLMELVHYSGPEILDDEEDWKTDDESETKKPPKQTLLPNKVSIFENKNPLLKEEQQTNGPPELEMSQHEIMNEINERKYIKDLFIQSNEDFEAAEILQHHQCNAQAILLFQQARKD